MKSGLSVLSHFASPRLTAVSRALRSLAASSHPLEPVPPAHDAALAESRSTSDTAHGLATASLDGRRRAPRWLTCLLG